MEQILNLQHISYTYHTLEGETPALSDISFSLNKGEFAAIVGPSAVENPRCFLCLQVFCLAVTDRSQSMADT